MGKNQKHLSGFKYADVILPVAIDKPYTYAIPKDLTADVHFGVRVEVQFGKRKRYAALVVRLSNDEPAYRTKQLISVIDPGPVVLPYQFLFWTWMAEYYCCSIGEVLNAAFPPALKLSSETFVILIREELDDPSVLNEMEFLIYEVLRNRRELNLDEIRKILGIQSVYDIVNHLFKKGIIAVKEEIQEKYKPQIKKYILFEEPFRSNPGALHEAFDQVQRSEKQTQALLALVQATKSGESPTLKQVREKARVSTAVIHAMQKKGIVRIEAREVNRFAFPEGQQEIKEIVLSQSQEKALHEILDHWQTRQVVLLHGVTGSGKTWIYKKLMLETLEKKEQLLYLLPEIGLSVQVIKRLKRVFGDQLIVYHSALTSNERVDIWQSVMAGAPIVVGVRSSIFLPFQNLSTIIVDEEHDASYKQEDPAPRYNARDSAIYLASMLGARVLLGTATPSIESYHNCKTGKYGYTKLDRRYSEVMLPELHFVDLKKDRLSKESQFSNTLVEEIRDILEKREQVIIFKNRRGYAPKVRCQVCDWIAECPNCDLTLTYHKFRTDLHCHYCGFVAPYPNTCPACGSENIKLEGYGTQKLEDELQVLFPEAQVGRMDYDTTRRKHSHHQIIEDFETGKTQILVGTQMVTKGLDFDHVGLVGIIHADMQLFFPHFRAYERSFQLLTQVSGRAGRKQKRGKVIIQTYVPGHAVFADIALNDYISFYHREIEERSRFKYPPFYRLVKITLKHKKRETVKAAAEELAKLLRHKLDKRVMGPAEPYVSRLRGFYLRDIGIRLERDLKRIDAAKMYLKVCIGKVMKEKGMSTVRINVDVDPN